MITLSIILFAAAALVGLTIAIRIYQNKNTPLPVSLLHGFFAVAGITMLIIYVSQRQQHSLVTNIVLFSIAATGGIFLFVRDMLRKTLPKPVIIAHAGIALLSFAILLFAVLG